MSDIPRRPSSGEPTVFQPGSAREPAGDTALPRAAGLAGTIEKVSFRQLDEDLPDPPARARPRNYMVEAAASLLTLAASVQSGRVDIDLPAFHRRAAEAASRFDAALVAAGYDGETRRRARYAVFATVDDIAQNLPGRDQDGAEWARRSMVVRGFSENIGGDRFWQLLNEMLARPTEYLELIELYHACLAAGFEGRHRTGDAAGRLRATLRSAYAVLPQIRSLSETELVPAWRGMPMPRGRIGFSGPVALVFSLMLGLLLLVVLALRLVLIQTGQPSMQTMLSINPATPLRLARAAPRMLVPTSKQERRVQGFLADEIARKLVVVEQDPNSLRIRTTVGTLFASGSDLLAAGRKDLFEQIATAAEREKGAIRIEGHADSDPVSSLTFPDNVALSRARAERVAEIIRAHLTVSGRVSAEGFGAAHPIASNATARGRAQNRRVEIVIPRSE